ncbi:MAG: transposase [Chloroflexi bacterium]|nr:transposase [Chloroflexota bacterium]
MQADPAKREAFVHEYVALQRQATATKAKIFFVDEAHFYADVDLHAKWVLKGEPAFVESTSPRWGEKASYYSAVCPETGEVDAMPLEGNSSSETSVAFLKRLRARYPGALIIIWDNGPAHGGDALRAYLRMPGLASASPATIARAFSAGRWPVVLRCKRLQFTKVWSKISLISKSFLGRVWRQPVESRRLGCGPNH